ncbi:MAG: succinyldiaminopimelate transaminase [Actinomycetaceae bacterium]|nr:succinyldiaminopimelate transaminase [Actinomycetaceae bacterium]
MTPNPRLPRPPVLPIFPWDTLLPAATLARQHPDGIVDLSVGTPVDDTPVQIQDTLKAAANAHGYPPTIGTKELQDAIIHWFKARRGVDLGPENILPSIGSKELVASLPMQLGMGVGDRVGHPEQAYPTYDIGARLAGATPIALPEDPRMWPTGHKAPALVWINSPGNPTGHVLSIPELRAIVAWARQNDVVIASDECYAELPWEEPFISEGVPSLLDPRVTDGDMSGLLVVYSLSKQSNMAGYRAAFVGGDARLIEQLREIRKHSGLMVPAPVQAAMVWALNDVDHVVKQRNVYQKRRLGLLEACRSLGLSNDPNSVAGLYLYLKDEDDQETTGRDLLAAFARLGILVAPGDFYGPTADNRVRMALTGTDERISAAISRLQECSALNKNPL